MDRGDGGGAIAVGEDVRNDIETVAVLLLLPCGDDDYDNSQSCGHHHLVAAPVVVAVNGGFRHRYRWSGLWLVAERWQNRVVVVLLPLQGQLVGMDDARHRRLMLVEVGLGLMTALMMGGIGTDGRWSEGVAHRVAAVARVLWMSIGRICTGRDPPHHPEYFEIIRIM